MIKVFYFIFILVIELLVSQHVYIEIFGTRWYGLIFTYLIFLLIFVVIGAVNYKLLNVWEKTVLYYLVTMLILEIVQIRDFSFIPVGLLAFIATANSFSFHYYLFNVKLKRDIKKKGIFQLLSILFVVVLILNLSLSKDLNAYPITTVSLFFIYLISISLLGLLSIIDLPGKQALFKDSFFLFLLGTLIMYSIHFWVVSLRYFIHDLEMETILKHRFLMLDLSRIIMVLSYGLMSLMFFKSRKKLDKVNLS